MASPIALSRRPALSLPFSLPIYSVFTSVSIQRGQATYRRTKQRLRVKPDASFGYPSTQAHDHIIYNPPSSAPSAFRTPTKFLPLNDVRRKLRTDSPIEESIPVDKLPPVFRNTQEKKQHLTAKDIEEIRQLRAKDPMTWSRGKLAKNFGCSALFIGQVCEASPYKKQVQRQLLEAVKSRWGPKRAMAREDRQLRKELWAKDL